MHARRERVTVDSVIERVWTVEEEEVILRHLFAWMKREKVKTNERNRNGWSKEGEEGNRRVTRERGVIHCACYCGGKIDRE